MKIYHNPQCSKSSCALALLTDHGIEPQVIHYLQDTPKKEELINILDMLKMSPFEIVRKNELIFKEKYEGRHFTDEQWIAILLAHPILIERPIVVHNGNAIIARPAEKVLDLLK
ncbi:arsenate reductase (glutaredoxin) [Parapedobacter lycopersici]|uniref:arsenate reductase (glutaredoxin) n=1 Tax=Parapedobacter lycopersici TaxID=1864939 RepID=UPI00214DD009|nr:arsenate reductase (glutaredoxin) [Parapedobacter lycopersici]